MWLELKCLHFKKREKKIQGKYSQNKMAATRLITIQNFHT